MSLTRRKGKAFAKSPGAKVKSVCPEYFTENFKVPRTSIEFTNAK